LSSDGRFEVIVPRGAFQLGQSRQSNGKALEGKIHLQITQISGHYVATSTLLGTYQLQLVDSKGMCFHCQLNKPLTIGIITSRENWQAYGLNPKQILLTWSDELAKANASKQADKIKVAQQQFAFQMTNTAATNTLRSLHDHLQHGDGVGRGFP